MLDTRRCSTLLDRCRRRPSCLLARHWPPAWTILFQPAWLCRTWGFRLRARCVLRPESGAANIIAVCVSAAEGLKSPSPSPPPHSSSSVRYTVITGSAAGRDCLPPSRENRVCLVHPSLHRASVFFTAAAPTPPSRRLQRPSPLHPSSPPVLHSPRSIPSPVASARSRAL